MKQYFYLFLIFLISSCLGRAVKTDSQASDLKEWGVKGKVKMMTLATKFAINDSIFIETQTTVNYNESGNIVSIETTKKDDSTDKIEKSFVGFKYKNQDRFGAEIKENDTLSTFNRKWLTKNSYSEELYNKKENLLTINITELTENNRIEKQTTKIYKKNNISQLQNTVVSQYLFDKNDRLASIISIDTDNNETTETNSDLEFDDMNNATKSKKSSNGKNQDRIVIRQFEYYK